MKSVTMKEVAKMAEVSVQTVSSVINGKPGISSETAQRVLNAVDRLGYRPFSVARSLRTRATRTIAMVVSDIANPSFSTTASAAEDYLHSLGYTLVLYNTHDDNQREARYIQMASENWVDGMLIVSTRDRSESLKELDRVNIPYVVLDRSPDSSRPVITLDNLKAGEIAAEYLISLEHSNIAHISGPLQLRLSRERQDGFIKKLQESGISNISIVESAGWNCQNGYEAMKALLSKGDRPTALFAANDLNAIGAILAAYEEGIRVPDNLSVIGLDDIELATFQIPPLTTIRQSFLLLGMKGAKLLVDLINGNSDGVTELVVQPELIIRKSTSVSVKDYQH
jgi:DNA-binding LacI/PurR family transcriptional regulator